jgi:hypothetical protein
MIGRELAIEYYMLPLCHWMHTFYSTPYLQALSCTLGSSMIAHDFDSFDFRHPFLIHSMPVRAFGTVQARHANYYSTDEVNTVDSKLLSAQYRC